MKCNQILTTEFNILLAISLRSNKMNKYRCELKSPILKNTMGKGVIVIRDKSTLEMHLNYQPFLGPFYSKNPEKRSEQFSNEFNKLWDKYINDPTHTNIEYINPFLTKLHEHFDKGFLVHESKRDEIIEYFNGQEDADPDFDRVFQEDLGYHASIIKGPYKQVGDKFISTSLIGEYLGVLGGFYYLAFALEEHKLFFADLDSKEYGEVPYLEQLLPSFLKNTGFVSASQFREKRLFEKKIKEICTT